MKSRICMKEHKATFFIILCINNSDIKINVISIWLFLKGKVQITWDHALIEHICSLPTYIIHVMQRLVMQGWGADRQAACESPCTEDHDICIGFAPCSCWPSFACARVDFVHIFCVCGSVRVHFFLRYKSTALLRKVHYVLTYIAGDVLSFTCITF